MATRRFSLEPLSLPDVDAIGLVNIAGSVGFDDVSLVLQTPDPSFPADPVVTDQALQRDIGTVMKQYGLGFSNIECFNLVASPDFDSFARALQCGNVLGARTATAIIWENSDRADALSSYRRLCDMAKELDIRVNIEFIAMSQSMALIEDAAAFVRDAGRSNSGIMVDVLHLMRTGRTIESVQAIDPELIGGVQISDGPLHVDSPDLLAEAGGNRLYPGDGHFPLVAFMKAVPDTVTIGVEVPRHSEIGKITPVHRARRMLESARSILA